MIIKINPKNPQPRLIRKVVDVLEEGGVIAYPTDTIYGLGCDLYQKDAIEGVHRAEGDGVPGLPMKVHEAGDELVSAGRRAADTQRCLHRNAAAVVELHAGQIPRLNGRQFL